MRNLLDWVKSIRLRWPVYLKKGGEPYFVLYAPKDTNISDLKVTWFEKP